MINLHHKRLSSARVWIWCEKYAFPFDAFTPITIQLDVVVTNAVAIAALISTIVATLTAAAITVAAFCTAPVTPTSSRGAHNHPIRRARRHMRLPVR